MFGIENEWVICTLRLGYSRSSILLAQETKTKNLEKSNNCRRRFFESISWKLEKKGVPSRDLINF